MMTMKNAENEQDHIAKLEIHANNSNVFEIPMTTEIGCPILILIINYD